MLAGLLLAAAVAAAPADLSAVGVVLAGESGRSVAILRSQGSSRVVRVGENAFGGRVVAVAADGVSMEFGGERVDVRLRSGPGLTPVTTARSGAPEDPATPARTMMRAEVQRRLADETQSILRETAIAPVSGENGKISGFALTKLPPGLLTDAGLRPGDVLMQINGTPIDSLPTLISLWPRLQNEGQIQAVVLRNGQPVNLSVTLK